jgi:hypothetical protein
LTFVEVTVPVNTDDTTVPKLKRGVKSISLRVGQRFNPYGLFTGIFIAEAICRYKGLSPGSKLIYGRLCRYAGANGDARPAMATLGEECGMSESQARVHVKELVTAGFIEVEHRRNPGGSFDESRYAFLWHPAFCGDVGQPRKGFRVRNEKLPHRPQITADRRMQITAGGPSADNCGGRQSSSRQSLERQSTAPERSMKVAAKPSERSLRRIDDDDRKPNPGALPVNAPEPPKNYVSDRDELQDYVRSQTGQLLSERVLMRISERLEVNGLTMRQFIEEVKTHNMKAIVNPAGFITRLAQRLRSHLVKPEPQIVEPPKPQAPECEHCHGFIGKGIVPILNATGVCIAMAPCPKCATPEWAERIHQQEIREGRGDILAAAAAA